MTRILLRDVSALTLTFVGCWLIRTRRVMGALEIFSSNLTEWGTPPPTSQVMHHSSSSSSSSSFYDTYHAATAPPHHRSHTASIQAWTTDTARDMARVLCVLGRRYPESDSWTGGTSFTMAEYGFMACRSPFNNVKSNMQLISTC